MLPSLNPYKVEDLVCPRCATFMRRDANISGKSMVVVYYCDTEGCKFVFSPQLEHKNGTYNAAGYKAPPPQPKVRLLAENPHGFPVPETNPVEPRVLTPVEQPGSNSTTPQAGQQVDLSKVESV